jgi:putative DNA primase/helicase
MGAAMLEKPYYLNDDEWNAKAIIADCKKTINLRETAAADPSQREIERLAALNPIAYDGEREAAAERLSCRVSTLDKEVSAKRSKRAESEAIELCADTEPCAEPVNVSELLDTVRATVRRFIVCEPETATAATLWIAFTWIVDDAHVAPLAIITAPEKGCGKTQLLDVIGRLSRRALFASNISPAATFRVIEAKAPTLLIDEADAFFRENEELRGVINSGHTRTSAYVIRTVGDNHDVRQFSTWSAKAIAGIGRLPETVMSRGIILNLRRKLKDEKVERLRHAERGLFEMLCRKLARFGQDYGAGIGRARPDLPAALGDRAQDNWEPLLAIADVAGGDWPIKARRSALTLCGAEQDSVSANEELLRDIRDIFDAEPIERMAMAELLRRLVEDETAPWATWNRGKPMTPRQLGAKLKEFGIHAGTVHVSAYEKPKGFKREQFTDAWARYLDGDGQEVTNGEHMLSPDTPLSSVTQSPLNNSGGLEVTEGVTDDNSASHRLVQSPFGGEVTEGEGDRRISAQSPVRSPEKPLFSGQGDRVTDGPPLSGEKGVIRL